MVQGPEARRQMGGRADIHSLGRLGHAGDMVQRQCSGPPTSFSKELGAAVWS